MTIDERIKERQRAEEERWARRREIALANGVIIVQVSARRYAVARLTGYGGAWSGEVYAGVPGYFTNMNAEVVFGPAKYNACYRWLAENTGPLPEELVR